MQGGQPGQYLFSVQLFHFPPFFIFCAVTMDVVVTPLFPLVRCSSEFPTALQSASVDTVVDVERPLLLEALFSVSDISLNLPSGILCYRR